MEHELLERFESAADAVLARSASSLALVSGVVVGVVVGVVAAAAGAAAAAPKEGVARDSSLAILLSFA